MGSHHSWKQPLSVVSSAQLFLHQQLSASRLWCQMDQQPRCSSSWRDLRELIAWPHKLNFEQPSIVLNPCFHLVFVNEHKLTSIIAYTVLTNDVLFFCSPSVWLYGKHHHHLGILWRIPPSLCRPDSMFCHALGINVGSFCPLGLRRHASFLQVTEAWTVLTSLV